MESSSFVAERPDPRRDFLVRSGAVAGSKVGGGRGTERAGWRGSFLCHVGAAAGAQSSGGNWSWRDTRSRSWWAVFFRSGSRGEGVLDRGEGDLSFAVEGFVAGGAQ